MANYKLTPVRAKQKLPNLGIEPGEIIGYEAKGPKQTYNLLRVNKTDFYDVMKPSGRGFGGKMAGKSRHKIVDGKLF